MPDDFDPRRFREAIGHYPTGVAVVTARTTNREPMGMVVGSFSPVSTDPPLIAFFPMVGSKSFAQLRTADSFCVNVLAADQEGLCRRIATRTAGKFDGIDWQEGPLGSPVLDGAVSWLECTFEDVREAGDHYIVLGRVHSFAVGRVTLPLLYFQGGYGRFSPGSFIAAPDPELIQAARLAEAMRADVERLSTRFSLNCSVLAKVGWDSVQVLAVSGSPVAEPFPLGHRQPLMPPFGAVFMLEATETEIEDWLRRAPDRSEERRAVNLALLDTVRERGYSLLTARPEAVEHHEAVLSAFERSGRLPRHEREVRQATSELAESFSPGLVPDRLHDLANIVVPLPRLAGVPPMALRVTGLPPGMTVQDIEEHAGALREVAGAATAVVGSSPVGAS